MERKGDGCSKWWREEGEVFVMKEVGKEGGSKE